MARAKKTEPSRADELWEQYRAIQLTPEQKAAARTNAQKLADEAARAGTYERAAEIAGAVTWSMTWQELRGKAD